jgi:hypothetical protein
MSEWIDFGIYVVQLLLVCVFLPRQGSRFTLPTIADRNSEWLANHRDVAARLERNRWFLRFCYVWAAVSIAVLLGATLDLTRPPSGAAAPKWEVLKDLHATSVIALVLVWSACALLWLRWLAAHVPPAAVRRATLKPRMLSDYLSWPWRITVEALTVLHLGAWVVIGVLGFAGGARYWSGFALIVVITVLCAFIARWTALRRPGYADRLFGDGYRRVELRAAYVLRLVPLIPGGMLISEQALGLDPDRVGHLLLVSVISAIALVFLRLRPVSPPSATLGVASRLGAQ